jgi:hypothetical protein
VAVSVLQAGKIAAESVKDHQEFKEKLKQGIYDEKLAKRLKYAAGDAFLGRGTTEAIVNACSGKGSVGKSAKSCLKGAGTVVKALGGAVSAGSKAAARGAGNCLKAVVSKEHECGLKHAPKAIVEGMKSVSSSIGGWFSAQYDHHSKQRAKRKARAKKCRAQPKVCAAEEKLWKENEARARKAFKEAEKKKKAAKK